MPKVQGKSQAISHVEQANELVASIGKVNKSDAQKLMATYGSINDIVTTKDYRDFLNIDGIGEQKIESMIACFRG